MNTNRNVSFGSGIGPSGHEVESAMFTPEVERDAVPSGGRASIMRRLDDLKSRTSIIRSNVQRSVINAKSNARTGISSSMTKVQSSMRNSPAKWAAIAAGSGFAVGILGRILHARNEHHRHMPQLVVIETSC
ncbi:MAG: hypothetical protein ACJ74H_07800 [Thermoanaerobaculia bacterium]